MKDIILNAEGITKKWYNHQYKKHIISPLNINYQMTIILDTHEVSIPVSPLADIAGSVLVQWATSTTPDAINILITLRGVLCKVDACTEHAPNVRMPLIKALVDDGIHKGRAYRSKNPLQFMHPFKTILYTQVSSTEDQL